jgi:fatty acid desaturase
MAAAARLDPKQFFTPEEWAPLSARSSWKGPAMIAHAWVVIVAAGAMVVVWPLTLPLAVMIIGTRQLGLAILMHDAAHGALHKNLKLNDWMGEWLTGGGLHRYRPYHLTHHRFAQQSEDPDLGLSAPFPITPLSLRRKIVRDLTGQTFFKQRFGDFVQRLKRRKAGEPLAPIIAEEIRRKRRWLAFGAVVTAAGAPFGLWWTWPVLWVLPQATWYPLVTRLRNIAEHACIDQNEPDPMRQARTTRAGPIARLLIAPYYVNYHCEHHMFMHLPCYSLPRAHRLLVRKGVSQGMLTEPGGYLAVLRKASSKPVAVAA